MFKIIKLILKCLSSINCTYSQCFIYILLELSNKVIKLFLKYYSPLYTVKRNYLSISTNLNHTRGQREETKTWFCKWRICRPPESVTHSLTNNTRLFRTPSLRALLYFMHFSQTEIRNYMYLLPVAISSALCLVKWTWREKRKEEKRHRRRTLPTLVSPRVLCVRLNKN